MSVKKLIAIFLSIIESHISFLQSIRNKFSYPAGVVIRRPDLVEIGERVTFGGCCRIFNKERVSIGHDCMIAYGVQIITSTHDYNNHPMWIERVDRPVKIGKHVWIGTNAIILPGVIVSDYSVVGAGSVVTSHVPSYSVVCGNPARIIRYREVDTSSELLNVKTVSTVKGFHDEAKVVV